ncbi:hypothetical protein ACIQXD_34720 [Streptomyces uncialis]|uniref:hypothetical protein n=1 Tax=Streptomyces uncialis TaxID=1048205 RepID=UPI003816A9A1
MTTGIYENRHPAERLGAYWLESPQPVTAHKDRPVTADGPAPGRTAVHPRQR